MVYGKILLQMFDFRYLLKNLLLLLLLALLPFGDMVLLLFLGELVGRYLVFAAAIATGLLGFFLGLFFIKRQLKKVRTSVKKGVDPQRVFSSLAGVILGSLFLLFPGFITDTIGLIMLLPLFREIIGKVIIRRLGVPVKEINEFLKLYDM